MKNVRTRDVTCKTAWRYRPLRCFHTSALNLSTQKTWPLHRNLRPPLKFRDRRKLCNTQNVTFLLVFCLLTRLSCGALALMNYHQRQMLEHYQCKEYLRVTFWYNFFSLSISFSVLLSFSVAPPFFMPLTQGRRPVCDHELPSRQIVRLNGHNSEGRNLVFECILKPLWAFLTCCKVSDCTNELGSFCYSQLSLPLLEPKRFCVVLGTYDTITIDLIDKPIVSVTVSSLFLNVCMNELWPCNRSTFTSYWRFNL